MALMRLNGVKFQNRYLAPPKQARCAAPSQSRTQNINEVPEKSTHRICPGLSMGSKQPFSVHNILGKPPHDIKVEDVYNIEKQLGALNPREQALGACKANEAVHQAMWFSERRGTATKESIPGSS
eukprot:161036-Pelagomonas_calceolata.AAC.11